MERVKLLLIDAEEGFAQQFVQDIGGAQFDVTWEPNAAQGEQSARSWRPDLVILDVNLPDSNGFKLFTRLNRMKELSDACFVITGSDVPEKTFKDHQKLKRRADLYIHKPYRPDELRARLVHELGFGQTRSSAPAPAVATVQSKGVLSDPGRTQAGPAVKEEDYLDELDDLLADVDVSSLHSAARDDDADLNELDRLLGGEPPEAPPLPPDLPEIPDVPHVPDIPEFSDADEAKPPLAAAEEAGPVDVAGEPLAAEGDLDDLFPQDASGELDELLDAEEPPPEPSQVEMAPDDAPPQAPVAVLEEIPDEEPEDEEDPIAHVRESELAALIDKLESARAERDQALRELEALRQAPPVASPFDASAQTPDLDELRTQLRKAQDVARLKSQEATELSSRQEALTHALEEANEEIERLRAKMKTHGEDVASQYRETLTQAKETVDALRVSLAEAQTAREVAEGETGELRGREAGLQEARDTLARELEDLRETLEREKERAAEKLAEERRRATELFEREQAQMAERLERERAQAAERLERETGLLAARLEELGGGQQQADEQVRLLQARIAELERLVSDQATEYEKRLMDREEAERATLEKIEVSREQQLAALTLQLESAQERGDGLERERETLHKEMDGLRDLLAERSGEIKSLSAKVEELSAALQERDRRLEDTTGENDQRIAMLNTELARLQEVNARNEKRVVDAFVRLKADMEARARVEKALMLALKLVKSPGASGKTPQVRSDQG